MPGYTACPGCGLLLPFRGEWRLVCVHCGRAFEPPRADAHLVRGEN